MLHKFSEKELRYLLDTDYLFTKSIILEKVFSGLKSCSQLVDQEISTGEYRFDSKYLEPVSKISKGDNYRGLPYLVLDNPRYFKKGSVLSYRILFWWGNLISFSLHIEGNLCVEALNSIISGSPNQVYNETYYCLGKTPWEHHFEESNYQLVHTTSSKQIRGHYKDYGFIKIAKKATLEEWPLLNDLAISNFRILTDLTNLGQRS